MSRPLLDPHEHPARWTLLLQQIAAVHRIPAAGLLPAASLLKN